ncbi:hypothetical protein ABPG73_015272 [Tetrahymena malaccensis]
MKPKSQNKVNYQVLWDTVHHTTQSMENEEVFRKIYLQFYFLDKKKILSQKKIIQNWKQTCLDLINYKKQLRRFKLKKNSNIQIFFITTMSQKTAKKNYISNNLNMKDINEGQKQ